MGRKSKFSSEVRERAVRLVQEHAGEHESAWAATVSIGGKIGCTPQTLHNWVLQHESDAGARGGYPQHQPRHGRRATSESR